MEKKKHFQVLAHQTTQENTHEEREREREREREKLPDVMTGGSR
jgi:hypothetical protein